MGGEGALAVLDKLRGWEFVGWVVAFVAGGLGIGAMYGGDYRIAISAYALSASIFWIPFVVWEENRKQEWPTRAGIYLVAAIISIGLLYTGITHTMDLQADKLDEYVHIRLREGVLPWNPAKSVPTKTASSDHPRERAAVPSRENIVAAQVPQTVPQAPAVTQQTAPAQQPVPTFKFMTNDQFQAKLTEAQREREAKETPCRDDLAQCGDIGLLKWGKPLMEKLAKISDALSLDRKIAAERFSGDKYFKAIEAAGSSAADDFRECCAADAARYRKELAVRAGGGKRDDKFYDWVEMLLKPPHSKEWKKARRDADSKLVGLPYDIRVLEIEADSRVTHQLIDSMRQ